MRCLIAVVVIVGLINLTEISHGATNQKVSEELRDYWKSLMDNIVYNFFGEPSVNCYTKINRVQRHFYTIKSGEFRECIGATIDTLFNSVPVTFNSTDTESVDHFAVEFCNLIGNVFKCIEHFAPSQRICLDETERLGMSKLFRFLPEMKNVMCENNAETLSRVVEYNSGFECASRSGVELSNIKMFWYQVLMDNETNLFTNEKSCFSLQKFWEEMLNDLNNCSEYFYSSIDRVLHRLWHKTDCPNFVTGHTMNQ